MAFLFSHHCISCGIPLPAENTTGFCPACYQTIQEEMGTLFCAPPAHADAVVSAGYYKTVMRKAVLNVKFGRNGNACIRPLAQLMAQAWERASMPMPDVITCVPIHRIRMHFRGYNQSAELANSLAEQWQLPMQQTLYRHSFSKRQARLPAKQRWSNAKKAFYLRDNIQLYGQSVLLIDDIVTTGATIDRCSALLKQAGAAQVWVLAAAQAVQHLSNES